MKCELKSAKQNITQKLRDVATFLSNPTQKDLQTYKNLKLEATRRVAEIYKESKLNLNQKDFDKILTEAGLTSYNLPYKVNESTAPMRVLEKLSMEHNFQIFNNHNSAYTQVYNYFLQNLTKYTFLNQDRDALKHYVISSEDFNQGFIELKNHLVEVLSNYVNVPVKKIFNTFGGNIKDYTDLMERVNTLFLPNFNLDSNIVENLKEFEVFSAAYILNNFDNLVEEVIGEMVDIDPQLKGDINNVSYSKNFQSKSTVYWLNDTHEAKNAKNFTSNITKFLVRQIPKVTISSSGKIEELQGQFLDVPDLFLMSSVLKQAEYEYNLLHQNKQINFFGDQKNTLKTLLTLSKEEVEQIPVLKKFQNQLISLKTFLYTGTDTKMSISEMYDENVQDNLKILDVEGLFAFEIGKTAAPSYISYDGSGMGQLINYSQAYNSSQQFIFNLENFLYVDADASDPILKKTEWFKNLSEKSFENLKSDPIFQKIVQDLFGIAIKDTTVYDDFFFEKLEPSNGYETRTRFDYFKELLPRIANRAIEPGLSDQEKVEAAVKQVEDISISSKPVRHFNLFKLATAPLFNNIPRTTFENSEGNTVSVYRLNSLFLDDNHLIQNYKKTHGKNSEKYNFFASNPIVFSANNVRIDPGVSKVQNFNDAYTGSTAIKLEANAILEQQQASKFSPSAQIIASYIGDFLSLKGRDSNGELRPDSDIMGVQVACFSDKITILLKMVNLASQIKLPNGDIETLGNLLNDSDKLLHLDYYYRKNQTLHLMNDILKDWSQILNLMPELNLPKIQYLTESELTEAIDSEFEINSKIFEFWNDANNIIHELSRTQNWEEISSIATKLGINLTEELHFSKYKFKNKKGFYLNNSILYTGKVLSSFDFFKQTQEKNFNKFLAYKNGEVISQISKKIKVIRELGYTKLTDNFFNSSKELNFNALKNSLKSYLFMSNFIRHQYLDLTVKEPFLDPAKGNILEIDDFNAIDDPGKPNNYSEYAGAREYSLRMDASQKRMVIGPGTIENFLQNTLRGVSSKVKCAIIEDAKEEVFNASGSIHNQDIFDGCGFISPYESRMENESLPGKGATETKKTLGVSFTRNTSSLFKWAEMVLNNWKIRNSKGCKFDLEKMFKKMHNESISDIDLTKDLFGRAISYKKLLDGKRIFYKQGFRHYEIIGLIKIPNSAIEQYQLKVKEVDNLGNSIGELKSKSVQIDTIYDLWKVLGGYESEELFNDKLVYGELNNDLIYELIISVGNIKNFEGELNQSSVVQPLRNKFIGIVANKSSVKRGIINTNSSKTWTNSEELSWFEVDTSMFGQQMDANHNAEEGDVTEPTQAMSALAALGYTQDLAQEAYEQVATIIQNALKNINTELKSNNVEGLSKSLSKRLIKEIISGDKINLAQNIIYKLLETDLNPILPFSDANFYKSLVKNIVVTLNKSAIKRRFQGLGGILNPSSNILQLYRINGKNYSFEDLLKQAENFPKDLKQTIEDCFQTYNFAKLSKTENEYLDSTKMSNRAKEQIFNERGNLDWAKTLTKITQLYLKDSNLFKEIDEAGLFNLLQDKPGKEFSGLEEVPISDINLLDYVYDENSNKSYCLDTLEKYVDFIFKHQGKDVLKDTSYPTDLRPQQAEWAFVDQNTKEVTQVQQYQTPAAMMANFLNKRKKIEGALQNTVQEEGQQEIAKCKIS